MAPPPVGDIPPVGGIPPVVGTSNNLPPVVGTSNNLPPVVGTSNNIPPVVQTSIPPIVDETSNNLPPVVGTLNLDQVRWEDVQVDEGGNAVGVFDLKFKDFSSKQLRTLCSRLGLKGVKNARKQEMIDRLIQGQNNWKNYAALLNRHAAAPRKQAQCSFRLMNILFSDSFADQFATLGDIATRQILDKGTAANDEHFWQDIQQAFVTPHEDYNNLLFDDDDIFADCDIDPGNIVQHDWKKLRTIWKAVNADYKAALTRYTISGTNENEFYNFCNGKLDVYYLRKHLELRPNLNSFVEADLPVKCALSSDRPIPQMSTPPESESGFSLGTSTKKRRRSDSDSIVTALQEFGNGKMRAEFSKQKLQFMQKTDARKEEENLRDRERYKREKEAYEREKVVREREDESYERHKRKEKEAYEREKVVREREDESYERHRHQDAFKEWEQIQANIRMLRKDLRDLTIDDDDARREIKHDIASLTKRKNKLSSFLGLE